MGYHQEFLVPLSAINATQGNAFRLEMWLNDVAKVFPNTRHATGNAVGYQIEEVAFEMELVEVSPDIMADINRELANGSQIPLPYTSWRSHTNHMSSGKTFKANISESAHNVEAVYSVMYPQTAGSSISAGIIDSAKIKDSTQDPYRFTGSRFKFNDAGNKADNDQVLQKYSYRYGSKYYPLAPVDLNKDSVLALENIISGFELDEKMPFLSENVTEEGTQPPEKAEYHFVYDPFHMYAPFLSTFSII